MTSALRAQGPIRLRVEADDDDGRIDVLRADVNVEWKASARGLYRGNDPTDRREAWGQRRCG